MGSFFQELRRRNVFKVGVAYLALAWLLVQIGSTLIPLFGIASQALRYVIFVLVLGFPLALLFAWAYELTPDGLKRSNDVDLAQSVSSQTGQRLNHIIISIMGLAILALLVDRFAPFGSVNQETEGPRLTQALGDRSYESIAVLPFVNMSSDAAQDYFSDGISEELLNLLAKTKGLRVAARTSSFAYKGKNADVKEIGDQLDVQTVLEGSVRKSKSRLRITAQLIDVDTGYHLWSETYDRELDDIFVIQDEISGAIVSALQVHFGGEMSVAAKSTEVNVEAYQDFLMGHELVVKRTLEGIEKSVSYFTSAIEKDPTYAAAYADKAVAYLLMSKSGTYGGDLSDQVAQELAEPLIAKSIELGPDLPDGYAAKGFYHYQRKELDKALADLDKALALQPSHAIARMWKALALIDMHRSREALEAMEAAHKIDPLSLVIAQNLVLWRLLFGDVERADELAQKMKDVDPERPDRWARAQRMVAEARHDFSTAYELVDVEAGDNEEMRRDHRRQQLYNLGAVDKILAEAEEKEKFGILAGLKRCEEAKVFYDQKQADPGVDIGDASSVIVYELMCNKDFARAYTVMGELVDEFGLGEDFWKQDFINGSPAAFVYLINSKTGRNEKAAEVWEVSKETIERLRADGLGDTILPIVSQFHAVRGELDQAMDSLERAFEVKRIGWLELYQPMYEPLVGTVRFEALRMKMVAEINAERADLGWEPLSADWPN